MTDFIFLGSKITEDGDCCHSVAQSCPTLCDPLDCSTPGFPVFHHLPELAQTHVHRISDAIQTSHPLSSPSPTAFNFSNESVFCIRWPKYWNFSFSISPSNEYSGLIFFRVDWLDLLAVQGTLRSLFHHHSSKASIIRHSAFFTIQLSHPYRTTGKTIALTRWTFVGKVMPLLFNMLSRLVINNRVACNGAMLRAPAYNSSAKAQKLALIPAPFPSNSASLDSSFWVVSLCP